MTPPLPTESEPAVPLTQSELSVAIDGELRTGRDAALSVWDHGFLYGDGCFEGLRLFDGRFFRFADHLARLQRSVRILGIAHEVDVQSTYDVVCRVVVANELTDAHVRIIVTRGQGTPGIDPRVCPTPSVVVMAYPMPPLLGTDPVDLVVSSVRRKAPGSVDAQVKSLNYLDSVLAKQQANAAGAHDAVMLDDAHCVSEATGANLFVVRDGVLRTPTTRSALPGITRRTVLELTEAAGRRTEAVDLTVGDLYTADECFLTGSGAGIVPVGSVDGRRLPSPRPVTEWVKEAYGAATHGTELTVPADGTHRF